MAQQHQATVTEPARRTDVFGSFDGGGVQPRPGSRGAPRVLGDYVLTEEDVVGCERFGGPDGLNGWPNEEHVAGDIVFKFQDVPNVRGFNHRPFRMLLPRGLDNLLVAGRCASMTHMGQSAARVSGACFVMGEAAGEAAAMVASGNGTCRDVEVRALQQRLAKNGAFLGLEGTA